MHKIGKVKPNLRMVLLTSLAIMTTLAISGLIYPAMQNTSAVTSVQSLFIEDQNQTILPTPNDVAMAGYTNNTSDGVENRRTSQE